MVRAAEGAAVAEAKEAAVAVTQKATMVEAAADKAAIARAEGATLRAI